MISILKTVGEKVQGAAMAELTLIGVPATRVRLIFNQFEDDDSMEKVFETLLTYCAVSGAVQPTAACTARRIELAPEQACFRAKNREQRR